MAGLTDLLFNAAGGGVIGSLLHIGSSWFDTYRKRKEAEVEILLLEAKVNAAEKEAAWNAFAKSQEGVNVSLTSLPAGTSPIMVNIYVGVEAIGKATRPLLTWMGVFFMASVYFSATIEQQQSMQAEIQLGCWTMVFWYFGARYSKQPKK